MPREFDNMQGGHASDAIGDGGNSLGIDFFQPGVSAFMPGSRDRDCVMRILPAFDGNLSVNDQSYRTSFMDYRLSNGERDKETSTEAFTPWYFQCIGYPYLGKSKTGILSPKTLEQLGGSISIEDTACPVFDCQQKTRNSEKAEWKALTEGEDKRGADLPFRPTLVLMNALWSVAGKEWNQGIYIFKHMGLVELKGMLSWRLTVGAQPLSSHQLWKDYLFGDVTHPTEGLLSKVYLSQVGSVSTYLPHFSNEQYTQKGVQQLPVGDLQLQQRHLLGSSKTLKILTYQEIVDWIIQDGFLPHELVQSACGQRANVPERAPIRYDQQSTSLPPQGAPAPSLPASGPNPMQKVQMKVGTEVYENPLHVTKDWVTQNPTVQVLIRPSDNSHDWCAPNQSPLFVTPQPPAAGLPAMGGGVANGLPGMVGQAPPQAPGMAGYPAQQAPPQAPPTYQQAPPSYQQAPPQALPGMQSPGGMGASNIPSMPGAPAQQMPTGAPAPALPGMHAQPAGAPMPASPAAPHIPDPAMQDGIPGLLPGNGGPPAMTHQPGVPAVAMATDQQPVPMGAPSTGSAGALTPQEQYELSTLQARASGNGDPLQPSDVARFAELNYRSVNG